jgi:copper transport protein
MRRRFQWMAVALCLLLVATATQVLAHANLLQAEPQPNSVIMEPPTQIILSFTEALEPSSSSIELLDGSGQPVNTPGPATVDPAHEAVMSLQLPPLEDGVYTVSWRALSAVDGHLTRGVYGFIVGEATAEAQAALAEAGGGQASPGTFGEASPLGVLARMLTLVGGALLVGGFALHLILWSPLRAALGLDERAGDPALARLLATGLALGTAGTVLLLVAQIVVLGSLGALNAFLHSSSFGVLLVARFGLLAILDEVSRRAVSKGGRFPLVQGLLFGVAFLATLSIWSHSAAVESLRAAALLNDWLHLVAASVWIGGLAHFFFVSLPAVRALPPDSRGAALAMLIRRFSPIGICAVAVLAVTGLYSGWLHVGSVEALRTTAYGQTLLAKLALSVPLVLLAAANLLYWRRTVVASLPRQGGFVRTLGAETLFGFLVLAVVGLLTTLSPARGVVEARQSQMLVLRQPAGPLQATLQISPPRLGPARYEVMLRGPDGAPYDIARRVRLQFAAPDAGLGIGDTLVEPQGEGRYVVEGAFITLPGPWQVELQVQRPDGFDAFTTFDLVASDTIRPARVERTVDVAGLLNWALIGTGIALALFAFWMRLQREDFAAAPLVLGAGVVLLAVTGLRFFDPLASTASATSAQTQNPIPITEASLTRGEALYEAQCMACHGALGFGDGPNAAGLDPPPANLHLHAAHHTDGDLFRIVTEGVPGTAMPSFEERLAAEERWHVINYLDRLTGQ